MTTAKSKSSDQHKRFIEAARDAECSEDEAVFDENLRRIAPTRVIRRRVDAKLEDQIRSGISAAVSDVAQSVHTEIQQDGQFLLINIVPETTASVQAIKDALARARLIIEPAIPPRVGLHSWMILVTKERDKSPIEAAEYSEILPGEID